jgi:hypothetical protein
MKKVSLLILIAILISSLMLAAIPTRMVRLKVRRSPIRTIT